MNLRIGQLKIIYRGFNNFRNFVGRSYLQRLPVDVEYLAAEVEAHGAVRPAHDARVRLPLRLALLVETNLPSVIMYCDLLCKNPICFLEIEVKTDTSGYGIDIVAFGATYILFWIWRGLSPVHGFE